MVAPFHQATSTVALVRSNRSSVSITYRVTERWKVDRNRSWGISPLRACSNHLVKFGRTRFDANMLVDRRRRRVEKEKHLAPARRIEPRKCKQPGLVGRKTDDLQPAGQRR